MLTVVTMENFINGYPGHEHQFRESLAGVIGKDKAEYFFDKVLHFQYHQPRLCPKNLYAHTKTVPRTLVHRRGCEALCFLRLQLYPTPCEWKKANTHESS